MRIGIDVRASQLRAGRRGLGAYTFALAEGLSAAEAGHKYVLIALPDVALPDRLQALLRPGGPCRVVTQPSPLLRWDSWAARRLKLWRVYFRAHHFARRRELERVARRERLDVLHLPIPVMVDLSFACDARPAGAGCAIVKTLHDTTPIVLGDAYFSTIGATRRYTYLEQMSWYRDADAVVAISTSARDDGVQHLGLDAARIRVVSPAVPGAFTPATNPHELAAVRARHGIGHPYFLVCSGEGVNKNFQRIIEAFAGTITPPRTTDDSMQLVIAGPLGDRTTEHLKALAFELGLTRDRALFTGYIPESELVALFAGALAVVSPSLYEGFGLPAAQAMRMGTPVIASDRSSFPEVVGDAGLLVDPYDTDAIASAMIALAGDPALRSTLSARGRERAPRYTTERQAREILGVYESVIASRRG